MHHIHASLFDKHSDGTFLDLLMCTPLKFPILCIWWCDERMTCVQSFAFLYEAETSYVRLSLDRGISWEAKTVWGRAFSQTDTTLHAPLAFSTRCHRTSTFLYICMCSVNRNSPNQHYTNCELHPVRQLLKFSCFAASKAAKAAYHEMPKQGRRCSKSHRRAQQENP